MISYNEVSEKSFQGFIIIFITQFISMIGSMIVSFAVIWYLAESTESSLILSIASIASIVPMIIVSPFSGVIADKFNKNLILIISDATQALATFVLIILFQLNVAELWHILVLLGIRGTCQGFQNPVSVSLTPLMVPEKKIKKINSINQIFNSLINIASPAIGAIAVSSYTIQQIYWLDVFTFIPTAVILFLIRIPSVTNHEKGEKISFKKEFGEGLSYIKESGLTSVFIMFATANFIVVPIFSLFPLLILGHHEGTVTNYSWVEVLFQVGMIGGSILLMSSNRKSTMKSVITSGMFLSVVLIGLALVPQGTWWLFYIACAILGIDLAFIDTQLMSVLQVTIPKELQGRVFASMFTIIKSLNPVGLIIWGIIGEFTPIVAIFIISPAISIIVYFILIKFTTMMQYGESYGNESIAEESSESPAVEAEADLLTDYQTELEAS
ncbi:MFS transporter [Candidatus Lokiarchaeum ossiferum]|uniref:MFS transporter n=1 Tax=Candidatus Lokiarchaeum ossiferum TaxID=2951803 RepID=UPI00352CE07C